KIHFHFRGKGGKEHAVTVQNRQLARIVKRCQDLPGYELFQYLDEDGHRYTIESDDVNTYLRDISGHDFTAKDFRTWAGTVFATNALYELGAFETQIQAKKNVSQAIDVAAAHLGNTKTICRKCYIHPGIIDAYLEGNLLPRLEEQDTQDTRATENADSDGLRPEEVNVLAFLKESLAEIA
nr:hypothetical protein [Ktedonobacteraceae bacterium]